MISIVSAIWQRPALTKIFLDSLVRYKKDYGINAVVAGSEKEKTRNMCIARGIEYIETDNKPLSNKFNNAARWARVLHKPKAFLILGSDDFLSDSFIQNYLTLLKYDVVGITDCYFYHTQSKEAMYWKGYTNFRQGETIGLARMLSREVYDKLNGKLWPQNMNSGLDYTMMQRLKKIHKFNSISLSVKDIGIAVDIKGQGNITGFDCYRANMAEIDESLFDCIPEFRRIKEL